MNVDEVEYLIVYVHRQTKAQRVATGDWLGIHYLSSFLNENGVSTLSFAGYAHEVPPLLAQYAKGRSLRMVGFSCDYENQGLVRDLCHRVREEYPELRLVVGGPQAFALDLDYFERSTVDVAICGEGELTSLDVCNHFIDGTPPLEEIAGIRFLRAGQIVSTGPRKLIQNLDALPFPNPDYVLGTLFRRHMASFLTGRGCPYACAFCYEGGNTRGVRWRSVANVLEEVEGVLSTRPDLHYLMFTDDTFTVSEARVREFCQGLRKLRTKYDFHWFCEGHVRTLYGKKDLVREMVEAGLACLQIGIESGCDEVLKAYGKGVTSEMIAAVVRDAYEVGVRELWGNIILGGAQESRVNIARNLAFCKELYALAPGMVNLDVVYFWPLPGTQITTHPSDFGMRIVDPFSVGSRMDYPVVEYETIAQDEFVNLRHQFVEALAKHALALVPKIPLVRAVDILLNVNVTMNRTVWFDHLSSVEWYRVFLVLLKNGATILSSDVARDDLWQLHPLRTGSVVELDEQGAVIVLGESQNQRESAVLKLASGKLTGREIFTRVGSGFPTRDDFLDTLLALEQKRVLAFSKY